MEQSLPLRDIHLPQGIGWWPPAVGWWILLALVLLLAYIAMRAYRYFTRTTATTQAVKLLDTLRLDDSISQIEKVRQLSCLLRRLAISVDSDSEVAGLYDRAWLNYLDQSVPGTPFTQGPGTILADGPYRQRISVSDGGVAEQEIMALMQLSKVWIRAQE